VLNLAIFIVGQLIAVKMVVGVDHVNVRHPQAAQRHKVVSLIETLKNRLFYLNVILYVVENSICCVINEVYWSEIHLKCALLMPIEVDVQLTLVSGYQQFRVHCFLDDLPGEDRIVGYVVSAFVVLFVSLELPFIW